MGEHIRKSVQKPYTYVWEIVELIHVSSPMVLLVESRRMSGVAPSTGNALLNLQVHHRTLLKSEPSPPIVRVC